MKKFLGFLLLTLVTANTFAAECKLNKAIAFSGDLLQNGLYLKNLELDAIPRFTRPDNYNPATDILELNVFNIEWNKRKTGYLGASIGVVGKLESVGFSQGYRGSFNFQGSTQETNGVKTYYTKTVARYSESQHANKDAIHEVWVKVHNNHVISIALSFPVFKVWKTEDAAEYIAFTGEHQSLCVTDAE